MARKICGALILLALTAFTGCNNDEDTSGNNATIASMTPNQVSQGQQNIAGQISGTNLVGVTSVDLGAGVVVNNFAAVSASQIDVRFHVEAGAGAGPRTVTVSMGAVTVTNATALNVLDNTVPRASFTVDPSAGSLSTVLTFDASASTDQGGNIVSYGWDFGDGRTGQGRRVTHKYTTVGEFAAQLTVTDNDQATSRAERTIEITKNSPPDAEIRIRPDEGTNLDTYTFDGSRSKDPDGVIREFFWKFGDGGRAQGQSVEHSYDEGGNYTVELTVTDNKNQSDTTETELKVKQVQGVKCQPRGNSSEAHRFTVISADRNTRTIIGQFVDNPGCRAFYRCGDVRLGGLRGWGSLFPEKWAGVMCEFTDLGGGQAAIKTVLGNYWPSPGDKLYTWAQKDCSTSVCR